MHPKFPKEVRHEVGAILSNMYDESIRTRRGIGVKPSTIDQ